MYVQLFGTLLVLAVVVYLTRRCRPSRFGLVFGMLVLYLPVHQRVPLNVLPMVNALTGFLVTLLLIVPGHSPKLLQRAAALRALIVSFLAVSLVGLALAVSTTDSATDLLTLFKRWVDPALFGLLAFSLALDEDRRFVVACVAVGYALVAAHAVREGIDYGALKRIPGLLGQPNETGAFLAMYAPLLLAVALFVAPGGASVALVGLVLVGGLGLVFTESRGAMLGYAVGILATLFASKRIVLVMSGLVLALFVYTLPEVLPERVAARFGSTIVEDTSAPESLEDELEPGSADRIRQWKAGLAAIEANPIGVGFNQFKAVIGEYGGIKGLDAHNFFVLVGVELGIVGLGLAIALLFKIGANAWAVTRHATNPLIRAIGVGSLGMLLAAVVVNFFGSRMMQEQSSTYLWILATVTARAADSLAISPTGEAVVASPVARTRRTA